MDVQKLVEVLRATLAPDQREQAEAQLQEVHKIIGFAPTLLQVVMSDSVDMPVRQAGVIYLKNLCVQFWEDKEVTNPAEPVAFAIHETDRQQVRDNIVEAVIQAPDPVRVQLAVCISQLVKHDYPGRWPGIAEKVAGYINSEQHNTWMGAFICLYQLVKNFEYKKPEERGALNQAMQVLLPLCYQRLVILLPDQSELAVLLQKQILKIFYALIQFFLPLDLITKPMFTEWMEVLRQIVDRPVPPETNQIDEEDRPELAWWKVKKWALHILARCFERYGSPGSVQKEYNEFSDWYLKSFSAGILQVLLKVLDQYRQKQYVSPRVLQQTMNYLNQGVSHAVSWKSMKAHMLTIVQDIIFPLMCHNKEDEELWQSDPVEYIRVKFDVFEEFFSPVTAAQALLHSAVCKRKEVLQKTMGFVMQVLCSDNLEPQQKAGALHMVGAVADVLLNKKIYKTQAENMIANHVFKEFTSPYGYLRARACWVLNSFHEVKYKNDANLVKATDLLRVAMCTDKELPVRVEAALAIQMLLTEQEKVEDILRPHIRDIIIELLKIIRETENDDLTNVMQKLVCTYIDEIVPLAVEICTHLAQTFGQVIEGDDGNDDKAITAMGILNTLDTIVTVLEDKKEVLEHIEGIILQIIGLILQNNVIDFYEEMLSLIQGLTATSISTDMWKAFFMLYQLFKNDNIDYFTDFYEELLSLIASLTLVNISPQMWNVFPMIYDMFKNDGFDYFTDMMPALHNYITVDMQGFASNPKHLEVVYDMCKTVLTGDAGEDAECHAAKLLEVVLLQYKGQVDSVVRSFVELALERLTREVKTSELRTMCLQVVVAALYYNPALLLEILNTMHLPNSTESIAKQFFEQWLHDTDCFLGLHDRKICVLGLCCMLDAPSELRPACLGTELSGYIVPSLILLFNGLQRAYAQKAKLDSEDSDEEEEGEDDEYDPGELEDEEDDIDEGGQEYMEKLSKSVNGEDDDEDSDDDDEIDEAEETALEGYTTPLDQEDCAVDEYQIFKSIFEGLQQKDPSWFTVLTAKLTAEQQKEIQEIFKWAEQRRAAQESKQIEQKGGYAFINHMVPQTFNFGAPPQ